MERHKRLAIRGLAVTAGLALGVAATNGHAQTIIWGNSASNNTTTLQEFNGTTGALLDSFIAPNPAAQGHLGRGIAVVGSTIFYSVADSSDIFVTNTSHADLGIAFNAGSATGAAGIGAIAFDGNALWLTPTGTGAVFDAYKFSLTGTLLTTIRLPPSEDEPPEIGRTGFEIVNGKIIANQGDNEAPYDIFNITGGPAITKDFFGQNPDAFGFSGVTFDGTTYYAFDQEAGPSAFREFDAARNPIGTLVLSGLPGPNGITDIQDVSTVFVPEPASLAILAPALAFLGLGRRRRPKRV